MPDRTYELGLHEVADGCHAYLQPDGGWGWSNAGLVVGDGASLLVDTLFDLQLTQRMLDSMRPITLDRADRHARQHPRQRRPLLRQPAGRPTPRSSPSAATAHEMAEVPPSMLAALERAPGDVGDLFRSFFGAFQFDGIEVRLPDADVRAAGWTSRSAGATCS